jgi:hypothetical protein
MTDELISRLKKIPLFGSLQEDALAVVAQKVTARKLAKDDVLMRKGEPGDSLFLINQGWVKIVTVDSKGDELILNKCGPGESIGAILDQRPDVSLGIMQKYSARLRFATTYIEKAIDWSQKTAAGDYSFVEHTLTDLKPAGNDDDKATELLSAFFVMVRKVKEREEGLKKQLEKLTFEIDQSRRKQEFEEITSTEFYSNLKAQAKALREKRQQDSE